MTIASATELAPEADLRLAICETGDDLRVESPLSPESGRARRRCSRRTRSGHDHDYLPDDFAEAARCPYRTTTAHARNVVAGQAGASASCMEAANASGPCSAAAGSIHMTCQPWPSRSKKLREYMKP